MCKCHVFIFIVSQLLFTLHVIAELTFQNIYLILILWPMKTSFKKWCGIRIEDTPLISNSEFRFTCLNVSLAWPLWNNFLCLYWPICHFQNSMKKFSHCISKRKMFCLHLEILKVCFLTVFFFTRYGQGFDPYYCNSNPDGVW